MFFEKKSYSTFKRLIDNLKGVVILCIMSWKVVMKTLIYIFYKELRQNNFNYAKVNQILMDYKQVKQDILQSGLIYNFKIEF